MAVSSLLDPVLSLLYPPRCLLCKTLGVDSLCDHCAAQFAPIPEPFCTRCGQALAPEDLRCSHCSRRTPAFDRARALGRYEGPLRAAIHQFKFRDRPQMAKPLGRLLSDYARTHAADLGHGQLDAVLPMPMHPTRRRLRGYNQAERLARVVAQDLGLPLQTEWLRRTRRTRAQVGLTGAARRQNLVGVFAASPHAPIAGKSLLLIDDVTTTGSSLHECAAVLKAAGAQSVYALTLAAG